MWTRSPEPSVFSHHHSIHGPVAVSASSHHHSGWSMETHPPSLANLYPGHADSAARFIFFEQINFPSQREEWNVFRYQRSKNEYPILRGLWISPSWPSGIPQGLAVFSKPCKSLPRGNGTSLLFPFFPPPAFPSLPPLCLSLPSPPSSLASYNLWEQENTNSEQHCL